MALAKGESTVTVQLPFGDDRRRANLGIIRVLYRTLADGTFDLVLGDNVVQFMAKLVKVVRNPDDAHTASWEFTLTDENAVELINNAASHASNTETDRPSLVNTYFLPRFRELTIDIGAAGDGVNGLLEIWFEW